MNLFLCTGHNCSMQKNSPQEILHKLGGVSSDKVTPDPIPNSEVKLVHGDDSTEEARR